MGSIDDDCCQPLWPLASELEYLFLCGSEGCSGLLFTLGIPVELLELGFEHLLALVNVGVGTVSNSYK